MIYRIPVGQVPQFWEHIKFAATSTDQIEDVHKQLYCNHLLVDLLASKKLVVIMVSDNKELQFLSLISYKVDKITGKKTLSVDNFYSWCRTTEAEKLKFFQTIINMAKKEGCDYVYANTYNPKLWSIAKMFNPETEQRAFIFALGG